MDLDSFSIDGTRESYMFGNENTKRRILNNQGWHIIFLNKKRWQQDGLPAGLLFIKKKIEEIEQKKNVWPGDKLLPN